MWRVGVTVPLAARAGTVTVWLVMATGLPLYTYWVGWPGTRVSW